MKARWRSVEVEEGKSPKSHRRNWCSEAGSIEAGLTIIPTTIFFLVVLQIVISGSFQVVGNMNLQNLVTRKALGAPVATELTSLNGAQISYQVEDLPGGGELITAKSFVTTPLLSSLIALNPTMKTQALAIKE